MRFGCSRPIAVVCCARDRAVEGLDVDFVLRVGRKRVVRGRGIDERAELARLADAADAAP